MGQIDQKKVIPTTRITALCKEVIFSKKGGEYSKTTILWKLQKTNKQLHMAIDKTRVTQSSVSNSGCYLNFGGRRV